MRLIDAELLRSNIEDRIDELSSEAVKGGLRLALHIMDEQPAPPIEKPVYLDAERVAEIVMEKLEAGALDLEQKIIKG